MFGLPGIQEFLFFVAIIILLNMTGLWPRVLRAFKELRGDPVDEPRAYQQRQSPPPPSATDVDMCFRILGLSPSATWEEVETAYRKKAKIHHPDLGGDEDTMRALNEAYNYIKRLRKR